MDKVGLRRLLAPEAPMRRPVLVITGAALSLALARRGRKLGSNPRFFPWRAGCEAWGRVRGAPAGVRARAEAGNRRARVARRWSVVASRWSGGGERGECWRYLLVKSGEAGAKAEKMAGK